MKDIESVWKSIAKHEGEVFYTARNLPFTYEIVDGYKLIPYRDGSPKWTMSKNLFKKAIEYIDYSNEYFNNHIIGSSYVKGILSDKRIIK